MRPHSGEGADVASYNDSIPQNGVTYYYKMQGFSPFGFYGPFSDVVTGIGVPDPLPLGVTIDSITNVNGDVVIEWSTYNRLDSIPVDLSTVVGYDVVYTADLEKKPTLYQSFAGNALENASFATLQDGYYFVEAYDSNNYRYPSIPYLYQNIDSIPPDIPTGLKAVLGADNAVRLTWDANPDTDLQGYYIFYAHGLNGERFQITNGVHKGTEYYTKTLEGFLHQDIYYGVMAVDHRENRSEISPLVHVILPDATPPAIPILSQVIPRPEGVRIAWQLSTTDDVAVHKLQRKFSAATTWETILTVNRVGDYPPLPQQPSEIMPSHYIDTDSLDIRTYTYRLVAIDSSDNMAYSDIVTVTPYSVGSRGEVINFNAILVQKMQTYTPYPGVTSMTIQNLSNTNLGTATQGAVKGAYISDGKVAKLVWQYDTDFPSSLEDFSIYQKIQSPISNNNVITNPVAGEVFVLIGTVKAKEAHRIGTANGVTAYMYFVEDLMEKYLPMVPTIKPGTNNPVSGPSVSSPYNYKIIANHLGGGYSREGVTPLVIFE